MQATSVQRLVDKIAAARDDHEFVVADAVEGQHERRTLAVGTDDGALDDRDRNHQSLHLNFARQLDRARIVWP